MDLRVTYDRSANAAFLYLAEIGHGEVVRTVEAVPKTVLLHFNEQDCLIGIEVLSARRTLPRTLVESAEHID